MKRKKITAILLASLMGTTMVPSAVWAADSYKETEKAAFAKAIEEFCNEYADELAQMDTEKVQGNAEMALNLDDGGKAIAGMFSPVDISWLDQVSIGADVALSDQDLVEKMDVNVNGTKICTVEYYMDTKDSVIYMRIPELSESYIKMNLTEITEQAEEEAENDSSLEMSMELSDAMTSYFSTLENLPQADALNNLFTRYSGIVFDNVEDGENPGTQTAEAGGISQELTVLEGHVTQKEAVPMVQQILSTAKEDEELKGIVETFTEAMNDPQYTYDSFIDGISELEDELNVEVDDADSSGFILRAWVDQDGEVVGRQMLVDEGEGNGEENLFRYLTTTDGSDKGFTFELSTGSDCVALEGSGVLDGDLLSGTYVLSAENQDIAVIDVTDYDTKATEEGNWKGTYTISGITEESEDGSVSDSFGGMQLVFATTGEDKNNVDWNLALLSGGVSLGSISITGGETGEALDAVDPESLTDVCDFTVDADIEQYTASMNLDVLTENLTNAGMPEGWLDSVMEAMSQTDEGDGTGMEDGMTEDQTDMAGDTLEENSETPAA